MVDLPSPEEISQQAKYIIEKKATVRETATYFNVSKSTIHLNCTKRLKGIDFELYMKVREILDENKSERNIRGGLATRKKWSNKT